MKIVSTIILPLVEKYRPKTRKDLIGNQKSIDALYSFIENWRPDAKTKAVILVGPPGTGKTSAVLTAAKDFGIEVVEFNSSDSRKKSDMVGGVAPLTQFSALSFDDNRAFNRIVLVDEVDGIHGNHDRGGVPALRKIIQESRFPMVLTANKIESKQVQSLSKVARLIEFKRMDEFDIFELLERVSKYEDPTGTKVSEDQLQIIADSAAGDIRAAINELESYLHGQGGRYVPPNRDRAKVMIDILNDIFSARTEEEARRAVDRTTSEYFLLLNYMFDLANKECKNGDELYRTYKQIANADLYLQRILRTQNYSYLRYFFNFLSVGVFLSREVRNRKKLTNITDLPQSLFARGRYKMKNKVALALAPKVSKRLHIPPKRFVRDEFTYLVNSLRGRRGAEIAAWLDLDDSEIEMVTRINGDVEILNHIEEAREVIGSNRLKEGEVVGEGLDDFSMDHLIQDALFEISLADLNKKKKRKKTTRKRTRKPKESAKEVKKKAGEKKEPSEKIDVKGTESEGEVEKEDTKPQTSLDDFF